GPQQDLIVDRVRYEAVSPWPAGANGGGSALQLIDASQDNSRVSNWTDGNGWKFFSYTANLNGGSNGVIIYLNAIADIYIDDLSLVSGTVPEVGENLIRDGDFEGPLLVADGGQWLFSQASLSNTVISTAIKHSGNGSLHLVHKVAGPTSYLLQPDVYSLTTNQHTLSFWYLP